MDDDPAATQARDKEALRNLANELLDLEGERDFRQAIAESLADGNPRDYEKALREYDSAAKTIDSKTLEKQRLEQRIRAAKNSARQSTRDATFGEDANMRAARDRWGVGTWIFLFCRVTAKPTQTAQVFHLRLIPISAPTSSSEEVSHSTKAISMPEVEGRPEVWPVYPSFRGHDKRVGRWE
ncbi:hypothetical protein CMEL01_10452 [Colletotrichum melonis]|uniref:Uncharacterized protein n=1 Tax=Colletotrichum melonis TaxID=1209925 RepID=A0AAI9TUW9_9PEZI|nr:hypothetical protein CMEL01_10452 [Colletotrichum melonis]